MSQNWKEYYNERLVTVEEAVKVVKSRDIISDGHGVGRSEIFMKELVKRADELEDVKILCGFHIGTADYCDPKYEGVFTPYSLFDTAQVRKAHWEGRSQFIPLPFSHWDRFVTETKPDVLFTHVTPPNENGYVSMGISVDFTRAALDASKIVVAQVNENMPWLEGDAVVPVTAIDYFVEENTPLMELKSPETFSELDLAIAKNVASLVKDGDTLQIGVGTIPDQVLKLLGDRKHLGVHTELGTPGIMQLVKDGVIDNSCKTLDRGYCVCTLMGGSRDFYDFVDNNPMFKMGRSGYVTNPMIIAQQKNMVSINSGIEVDLFGQVAADMIGPKQYGGVGGQLDFFRGASMAEGGRSILCMPSTAAGGKVSRIVTSLTPGAAITDTRYDVMYVVTEYGIASLWGKTVEERAKELIKIAHPDFREKLEQDYYNMIHKVN